jgi:MFS family permease
MTPSRRDRLGPLGEPQFRLLWIGQTTSSAGDAMVFLAWSFAVLRIGGDATSIGLVFAAYVVAFSIFVLAGGVWADRLPRQLVMVGADLVRGISNGTLGVLLVTGSAQLWHLVVGAALFGMASAFFQPASQGLIPETVSAARLQQANALMSVSRRATAVAGPTISGLIIALFGPGVVFLVDAGTFAVSTISLLLLRLPRTIEPAEHKAFLADLVSGWREVRARRWIGVALGAFAIGNTANCAFLVLGPVIADRHLGGAAAWGVVLTGGAIGGLLGGLLAFRLKPRRPMLVGLAAVSLTALEALSLIGPAPILLIAGAFLLGIITEELCNTWWVTMLQQHVPDEARSRVFSFDQLVSYVFNPLGLLLAGPLSVAIGSTPILVAASVLLFAAYMGAALLPSSREVTWVDQAPPADLPGGQVEAPIVVQPAI